MQTLPADTQALLENATWIRQLARRLVTDRAEAEDLAQDTVLAALEHRPSADRSLRGWLATVMRNRLRQSGRTAQRRAGRERDAAREDSQPSTLDLLERLSLHGLVVDEVRALEEPYRSTILLRYFEDMTPSEIAKQRNLSLSTVKTRLARAHERLRQRLDRAHQGDRRAWLMALLPLTQEPLRGSAPTLGALLLSTQTKVIAALVVATAAGWFTFESLTPAERMVGSPDAETLAAAPPAEVAALEVPVEPVTEKRIAATEPEPVATPVPAAAPVVDEIRGRIFHAEGRAGAGVAVRFVDRTRGTSWDTLLASSNVGTRVVADAAGRVVIPEQRTSGVFLAFDPDLATVLAGQVGLEDRDSDPVTVVGRALHLAGRVVDSNHAPLSAVRVAFQLPPDFRARFQAVMDYSSEVAVPVMTDEGGRFDLQYLAHVEGATLVFTRTGHERAVLELPDHPSNDLEVVLARADEEDATLRGRVVDADGRPMVGAYVSLGIDTRVTDEEGLFGFELGDEEAMSKQFGVETTALMAVAAGHLPVERVAEVDLATGEPLWPEFVELRLGGAPLSISGRVVSSDGDPLENIDVWAADTEVLGFDASRGRALIMENVLAERSDGENWHRVRTDAQGRFRIEGLADREYRIEAMDDETLLRVGLDAVRAGRSDAVLAMPLDGFFETVAGHVLTRDGDPIPGVRVSPQCDSFRARYRGRIVSTRHSSVTGTATDENGAFELRNVPRSLVYLRLDGENTIPLEYGRGFEGGLGELSEGRLEELEITLSLRLHFQVEIPADLAVDELCVLDSNGDEIIINVFQAGGRRSLRRIPMTGELSEVMAVTDDSETLVLFLAGEEVLRQPLSLTPGEVTTVRP